MRIPTPGTIIALIALFVSLAGTTYAATSLPANSVGTKQLKTGAVTNRTLRDHAVTGSKVADNSLTGTQINASTLGTVPNASHANSAAHADDASHANNAAQLGGLDSTAFLRKSDSVRIDAPQMTFGSGQNWDIGPITFSASCYTASDGSHHLDLTLLNNAFGPGNFEVSGLIPHGTNPETAVGHGGVIQSGDNAVVAQVAYPSSSHFIGSSQDATLVWRDGGETITGIYTSVVYVNWCSIEGTLTRTT